MILTVFHWFSLFMLKSESLPSLFAPLLFFKERWEWFALVNIYKRVTVSNSLLLLFKTERNSDLLIGKDQIAISLFHSQKRTKNQRENSQTCNSLLFRAEFAHALLSITQSIEQLWAIHSDRSRQMSDGEQITQVAHDKWATVSESLRSLMINEWINDSLNKFWL